MGRHKPKPVVAVDLRDHRRGLLDGGLGSGVEGALADALDVRRDAVDAVGIDTAEVRGYEAAGYGGGVGRGHAVAVEDVLHEAASFGGGDVDPSSGGGLFGCHGGGRMELVVSLILRLERGMKRRRVTWRQSIKDDDLSRRWI